MQGHRFIGLFLAGVMTAGCHAERPQPPPAPVAQVDTGVQGMPVGDDRTAMEAGLDAASASAAPRSPAPPPDASAPANARPAHGPALADGAPDTYVVKKGDTLWGISKVFLRDPWYWPEIWQVNPQIKNPHLIYPGDTLRLVYVDGKPRVVLQRGAERDIERGSDVRLEPRVRSQPLSSAITTIPYEKVAAFMSKPTVLTKEEIKAAPYVLATRDQHIVMANGDTVYARGFKNPVQQGAYYYLVRVGTPLIDPDDNSLLGYNGVYTGSGHIVRGGDPATLLMTDSTRETYPGDKLIPGGIDVPLDFMPSPPRAPTDGRIIAVTSGVSVIGQYQVVTINRGSRDGLAPGNVLEIFGGGYEVRDSEKSGFLDGIYRFGSQRVQLPDEPSGTFMVFKTFDRLSYGLIMEATDIIQVGDHVAGP